MSEYEDILGELFRRDPLGYRESDLGQRVTEMREARRRWAEEEDERKASEAGGNASSRPPVFLNWACSRGGRKLAVQMCSKVKRRIRSTTATARTPMQLQRAIATARNRPRLCDRFTRAIRLSKRPARCSWTVLHAKRITVPIQLKIAQMTHNVSGVVTPMVTLRETGSVKLGPRPFNVG